tara:strand:+ start:914 stop:1897 length:984 start_codon:yes stop_codon:yes gene_type:complete
MRIIILPIILFIFLINNAFSANNSFNKEVKSSSDVFNFIYFNDFDGQIITKQIFSFFGTEEATVAEIKINDSKAEFILKRNDNPSIFIGQNFDKFKLIIKVKNNSLEVDDVFTAKNHSSNWKKFNMSNSEKKLLKDAFNVMAGLIGNQKMYYQKRVRVNMHRGIQEILRSMGLNNTMEISGEQMSFDEIIDQIYIKDANNNFIKLNLRDYGMTFIGEACIDGRKSYVMNHDIGGVHIGYDVKDAESGIQVQSNIELTLFDDTQDKLELKQFIDSSFINSSTNCSFSRINSNNDNIEGKLRKLKNLLDEGLISQEQYDDKSSKILEEF